jgi:Raf kinase inhibitor-like YbhB/YbcL family protein
MKKKPKWIIPVAIAAVAVIIVIFLLNKRGKTDIVVDASIPRLNVASPSFENLGVMPDKHTGRGEDISPALQLSGIADGAVSIATIMDDLDVPWGSNFTHWVVWNIPVVTHIPEGLSHGETIPELGGATQGAAYGLNRYRGPMPPFGTHRYQFYIFVLDTVLDLDGSHGKGDLIGAMEGRLLQYGTIIGWYPREAN